jgi:L-alanine-DL-glutamate epimerase-like enolase superfamily enzyme
LGVNVTGDMGSFAVSDWYNQQTLGLTNSTVYWNSGKSNNRRKFINILTNLIRQKTKQSISLLEYGSHVGINIKLMKAGGIQETMRMIQLAKAMNLKIMLGCMIESSIAIAAAAHFKKINRFHIFHSFLFTQKKAALIRLQ